MPLGPRTRPVQERMRLRGSPLGVSTAAVGRRVPLLEAGDMRQAHRQGSLIYVPAQTAAAEVRG